MPPVYPSTGCRVLWNDKQRIHEYLAGDARWKLTAVETYFPPGGNGNSVEVHYPGSFNRHYNALSMRHGSMNERQYRAKYDELLTEFFEHHFQVTPGAQVPVRLTEWYQALDWTHGESGYGAAWYWTHGWLGIPHTTGNPPQMRHATCYHVAAGSHHATDASRALLTIPVVVAETPAEGEGGDG